MSRITDYGLIGIIYKIERGEISLIEDNENIIHLSSPNLFHVLGFRKNSSRGTVNYSKDGIYDFKYYELVSVEIAGKFLRKVPVKNLKEYAESIIKKTIPPITPKELFEENLNESLATNFLVENKITDLVVQPASVTNELTGRTRKGFVFMSFCKENEQLERSVRKTIDATKRYNLYAKKINTGEIKPKVVA